MKWKPGYPLDLKAVLERSVSSEEIESLVKQSSSVPRFVYGALKLPTVLKYFLDLPQSAKVNMICAQLPGYELYHFSKKDCLPTIRPSEDPNALVEGMLIFGLDEEQRNQIYEVEDSGCGQSKLVHVQVEVIVEEVLANLPRISSMSRLKLDAGTLVWNSTMQGLEPMGSNCWLPDNFLECQLYKNIERLQNSGQT
ncbi:hypothetical protein BJX61DRAFT_102287 [Aspergillus egyptiacus]|nr:hypothetical protein BJX61DRAFT_102287 [Aspergillus egyptiacus]